VAQLPTGTVTFLFTDIEGSTRKWQNWPHKMKIALKKHDEILQQEIEANNGWVFKTVGDAFCAAFHRAMDCVDCAIAVQKSINNEKWDLPEQIKVRMSIHTGEAVERNHDYYGPALNRVARLEAITYGGQVLMSLVTAELIRDMLAEPADLKPMGNHRLKDLTRPEAVFQLTHPDLLEEFPPIKSLDSHPHNIPIMPTLLIGRDSEMKILEKMLLESKERIISVIGPGGMGKTRISIQIAAELIEHFRNGVFFVDLTKIEKADLFYQLILSTLNIKECRGKDPLQLVTEYLIEKEILLILDNFEHIMDGAVYAAELLSICPGIQFLVTSREALHLRGEKIFQLPSLKTPEVENEKSLSVKKMNQYDSVRLFIERAEEVSEGFIIDKKNAPAIAQICVHLDGIPLAIELAAARITTLSPQAIMIRLNHRLDMLTQGAVDLPDRQHTLRSTIDWSYDLLDEKHKEIFIMLSVFQGGFDLDAAEAVCIGENHSVLDEVEHLLEKSLIVKKDLPGGEPWFYMLETIHEYASELLGKSDFVFNAERKYADYFFNTADLCYRGIENSEQFVLIGKLSNNHENLLSALNIYNRNKDFLKYTQMICSLLPFWGLRGWISLGREYYGKVDLSTVEDKLLFNLQYEYGRLLKQALEWDKSKAIFTNLLNRSDLEILDEMKVKYSLGWSLYWLNSWDDGKSLFDEVMRSALERKDELSEAKAGYGIAYVLQRQKHMEEAEKLLVHSISIFEKKGVIRLQAQAITNLGIIHYQNSVFKEAEKEFKAALPIFKSLDDVINLRKILNNLGYLNLNMKNNSSAIRYYKELLRYSNNEAFFLSLAYSGLASVNLSETKFDLALHYCNESIDVLSNTQLKGDYAISLRILGEIRMAMKEYGAAEKCFKEAIPLLKEYQEEEDLELAERALKSLKGEIV